MVQIDKQFSHYVYQWMDYRNITIIKNLRTPKHLRVVNAKALMSNWTPLTGPSSYELLVGKRARSDAWRVFIWPYQGEVGARTECEDNTGFRERVQGRRGVATIPSPFTQHLACYRSSKCSLSPALLRSAQLTRARDVVSQPMGIYVAFRSYRQMPSLSLNEPFDALASKKRSQPNCSDCKMSVT